MRSYRARNVVLRSAPQDNLYHTEPREGKGGKKSHQTEGWRMTGSAFPMHIGRGTLSRGWLRRITYIILNRAKEQGAKNCTEPTPGG